MTDNLMYWINKLSYQIVTQQLENEFSLHSRRKDDRYFKKCLTRVRRKGCDVLLNKSTEPPPKDPCITDYGGNWSPLTLITDYGRELASRGAGKYNDLLLSSIKTLEEKQYDNLNQLLKFLLLLKRPNQKTPPLFQPDVSLCGSDILHNSLDGFNVLFDDYSSDLPGYSSSKKALHYEESWSRNFDIKFQVLGELSKKNLLAPDKVSLDSLFSAKSISNNKSRSNSFVFTDFFTGKNCNSENLFDLHSNTHVNDNILLDNFVNTPITHKLPEFLVSQKNIFEKDSLTKSCSQIKRKLYFLPEEDQFKDSLGSLCDNISDENELNRKDSIELKRNFNFLNSFSVIYEKSKNCKSQESSLGSSDSFSLFKDKKKDKMSKESFLNSFSIKSKDIILGLWEEERMIINEFKPELTANLPKLRMITVTEYVQDVKYLLTGINSNTFQYNVDKISFNMEYGTCLEDVTPESLYHFSKEFLEIGNCYVKLSSCTTIIGKNNFDTCTTISQAFWKSIFDFLEIHYSVVLEIPSSINLMALKSSTRDLYDMITAIADICKVSTPNDPLPQGGQLITYLLQITETINKQCVTNIVFGILQNCCSVYLMYILQAWMFKGHFDKQNNEFFIDNRSQKFKTKSRFYYNSFFIDHDKIPSFLQGYEQNIFNCGKSIHFLKLFNIEDSFCQMLEKGDFPSMRLCLTEEDFEKLEKEFKDYGKRVINTCGESVTVKSINDEEKEREKNYIEYIRSFKKLQEEQRKVLNLKKIEDLKAKKDLQNKLLNEQRLIILEQKEKKKEEEEIERRRFLSKCKINEKETEKMLNEEKASMKNYYDNLLDSLDNQLKVADMRRNHYKKLLTKTSEESQTNEQIMNARNDNETKIEQENVDSEGNILETDINSNSSPVSSERLIREVTYTSDILEISQSEDDFFDENSNFSTAVSLVDSESIASEKKENKNKKLDKCSSYRNVAAIEAARNKYKILRSEFDLEIIRKEPEVKTEVEPEIQSRDFPLTDLEKNKKKVLESEYEILRNKSDHVPLKSKFSNLEISTENPDNLNDSTINCSVPTPKHDNEKEDLNFNKVELKRKTECMDLENLSEDKSEDTDRPKSDSSTSFFTPSNDMMISNENLLNSTETDEKESVIVFEKTESSTILMNTNYQNALIRDVDVFYRKLSHRDIFCSLKELENEKPSCTDFIKFQRYLKKSAIIPLKIQEKLANDTLLKHLLKGENLLSHLKSLRGYFFLNDGEFGRSFTYNTFRSLARCVEPQQFFERSNLSNIVNEALNYTIHNCEPNSQNLSFQIVQMPPFLNHSSHDVLSPFELSYRVDWPLNIILTEKALSKYKLVFKFLLKLKRINWTLNENFLFLHSHFKSNKFDGRVLVVSPHYHKIQIYRHAMTQVMITLDDYFFSNGVQNPWIFFLKDLETTENIDHLYQKHVRYIKDVLTRCFLTKNSENLLDCIHELIELALKFHYTAKSSVLEIVNGQYEHPKFEVLKSTFNEFCSVIKNFLKTLKEKIIANQVMKSHYVLIEKFDLKLT